MTIAKKEMSNHKIPTGWKEKRLGDLFDFKNGLNKEKEYFGHGTPIVNYTDVYKKTSLLQKDVRGLVSVSESELERFRVRKGDVFFTRTSETLPEIGLSSVLLEDIEDCVFSGYILRARPQTSELLPQFCGYSLRIRAIRKEIMRKSSMTTRALTSGQHLSGVLYKYPALPEQHRIVTMLETWDKAIEKLERKIEVKKQIKKGLMQKLLTGKVRLSGFTEEWETKEIGELLDYEQPTRYLVECSDYKEGASTPVLTANKSFILGYTNEKEGIRESLPVIIFDDFTTLNKFVNFPFKVKSSAIKILTSRNIKKFDLKFIFERMQLIDFFIGEHKRRYLSEYQYITIDIPSISEQSAIANILTTADTEIETLEKKLSLLQAQKKYLLNNLITGKMRFPEFL